MTVREALRRQRRLARTLGLAILAVFVLITGLVIGWGVALAGVVFLAVMYVMNLDQLWL
jgi:hypothetical protein